MLTSDYKCVILTLMTLYSTMRVPTQLLEHCLTNRIIDDFRLYLAVKRRCSGAMHFNKENIQLLCEDIGVKHVTLRKYLKTMVKLNWLGFDKRTKVIYVRGWKYVMGVTKLEGKSTVEVDFDKDIKNLKTFAFATSTIHYVKVRERTGRKRSGSQQKSSPRPKRNGPINLGSFKEKDSHDKLGVVHLGERYKVTPTAISQWKKKAKDLGYIDYKHNYVSTGVVSAMLPDLIDTFQNMAHKFVCMQGKVYIQCTDTFFGEMAFSTANYW